MANDKNVEQLSVVELDALIGRKRAMRAKADILVAEDRAAVDQLSARLAEAEVNEEPIATITKMREEFEKRVAQLNGRKGALVSAQHALDHVEAERQRRREVNAEASATNAKAALGAYARSLVDEMKESVMTITTMLKELRVRAQACRDADYALREALGVKVIPGVHRFGDPHSDSFVLEEVESGTHEVVHVMELFANGNLNAQINRRLAAEARARQRAMQGLPPEGDKENDPHAIGSREEMTA